MWDFLAPSNLYKSWSLQFTNSWLYTGGCPFNLKKKAGRGSKHHPQGEAGKKKAGENDSKAGT